MKMIKKYKSIDDIYKCLEGVQNENIYKSLITTYHKLNKCGYKKVLCSISGGSDSDILIDIVYKCDLNNIVDYVFFDTGLEYQATKDHIKYLENKYNIEIKTIKPNKPIPLSVKQYGAPFVSKHVSEMINRLQKHNFQWEDDTFENLIIKYPKCKSALEWWTNVKPSKAHNISQNKYLKEFLVNNNPNFMIAQKCCKYAKKDLSINEMKKGYDLEINGVRKNEGGVRANAYKSCFNITEKYDRYRPLFWYTDNDKIIYNNTFNIVNSECYTKYKLKRTGCCGCPFNRNLEHELEVLKQYEPKLYKATINIFNNAYSFNEKYNNFKILMKEE